MGLSKNLYNNRGDLDLRQGRGGDIVLHASSGKEVGLPLVAPLLLGWGSEEVSFGGGSVVLLVIDGELGVVLLFVELDASNLD